VRAGARVEIVGAAPCYIHLAGVQGFPQFVARMQPKLIMHSEDALGEVSLAGRDAHWLSSPTRDGKTIWETILFLLVGASAWGTDVASFLEPSMVRYESLTFFFSEFPRDPIDNRRHSDSLGPVTVMRGGGARPFEAWGGSQ